MTNSRAKGKRGELELAAFLRKYGLSARRGQQFQGGAGSPDVVCDGLAGYHIEVKRVEAGSLYAWLDQADRDRGPQQVPVVFHKKNHRKWVVIMPADAFVSLVAPRPTSELTQRLAAEGVV